MEIVEILKFFGVTLSDQVTWSSKTHKHSIFCHQIEEVIDMKPKIEAFIENNDACEAIYSLKQRWKAVCVSI